MAIMWKVLGTKLASGVSGIFVLSSLASAIVIHNYSPEFHDRFSSGYPTAPVPNTDPDFIGYGYDWSGVAWNANNSNQSFAMLGPRHFLYASHYSAGSTLNFFSSDGQLIYRYIRTSSGSLPAGS